MSPPFIIVVSSNFTPDESSARQGRRAPMADNFYWRSVVPVDDYLTAHIVTGVGKCFD